MPDKELEILPEHLANLPEESRRCPHCGREIIRTWACCPRCGKRTSDQAVCKVSMTEAENASYILGCLISYHERVAGINPSNRDERYISALRYALRAVETLFEKENGDTV